MSVSFRYRSFLIFFGLIGIACANVSQYTDSEDRQYPSSPYIIVLGIAQDAGFPQANCKKSCCRQAWKDPSIRKMVSCIAVVDPEQGAAWMIDATPNFTDQLQLLLNHRPEKLTLQGIFLTHAHIGHYTGLMYLGREVMGSKKVPVYTMPRMNKFLSFNGPWSQLVSLDNISLLPLRSDSTVVLGADLEIKPLLVPHRDEFSETVGFSIKNKQGSILYIPDIDKWSKWDKNLHSMVKSHSSVLIDGSFFANGEIPGRDMSEIPHPFVEETMALLKDLDSSEKDKIHFIHLNHTNPLLNKKNEEYQQVVNQGYHVAEEGQILQF